MVRTLRSLLAMVLVSALIGGCAKLGGGGPLKQRALIAAVERHGHSCGSPDKRTGLMSETYWQVECDGGDLLVLYPDSTIKETMLSAWGDAADSIAPGGDLMAVYVVEGDSVVKDESSGRPISWYVETTNKGKAAAILKSIPGARPASKSMQE